MEILDEITNVEIGGNLKDGGEMKVLCFCDIIGGVASIRVTFWGLALNYRENVVKIVSNLHNIKVGAFWYDI